jgi:hypothetical protein
MKLFENSLFRGVLLLSGTLLLHACHGDDPIPIPPPPPLPPPPTASFDITVANLTNAQPLSPIAVIAHQDGYRVFFIGQPASPGLEELAEGGDNTALLAEADADPNVTVSASGSAPIGPAESETLTVDLLESELSGLQVSISTMLVNTNNGITGINAVSVADLAIGDVLTLNGNAYDTGTEANSELAAHIPGPAGGGEGFNAVRDDRADQVAMHSGVVSQDDGFAASGLTEQHCFDNPVVSIRIVRID